jgi:hypothetical protein
LILKNNLAITLTVVICINIFFGCSGEKQIPFPDHHQLAATYYLEDSQWYIQNIPFFECSDKQIEQVYYYRWKLFKAHIRNVGDNQYVTTEFINDMSWDRDPYSTINAASMHHIYEGRWLKDRRYVEGYINNLYQDGGNNRSYSESIADATYGAWLVNADSAFLLHQLDSMMLKYEQWYDHYDSSKNLFYIPAMPDATEYTIASIDASGGTGGFEDGEAFRPTINSYMYGNALAISRIAAMKGDTANSKKYLQRATELRANVEQYLWNDSMQHFVDRFKVDNKYVHYWNFIRGRELAGMIPWYFNLPDNSPKYNAAWKHITDTAYLLGQHGLRTNEPSYEYYFKQIVFFQGQRGSQWNGPSWPFQTSLALTGMANLLNNYQQSVVKSSDYVKQLRLFTQQHFLPEGKINLVENYDPNLGGPIVYYYWSNHYNHSSYNNLVITGLCGIRPSPGDTLDIHPLVDSTINYFWLDDLIYHGHRLSVKYDRDGEYYHGGKGLTVFVDGKQASLLKTENKYRVYVGAPVISRLVKQPKNIALNITRKGFPLPSASCNAFPDTALYQAIDGRIWYFPEISNFWSTKGSNSQDDWYALDFGRAENISGVKIYLFSDGKNFGVPDDITIEYQNGNGWKSIKANTTRLVPNTGNAISFDPVTATQLRIHFKHGAKQIALCELECY